MDNIHLRIAKVIEDKHIKKVNLANELGITSASVTNFCNGKTKPSNQTITMLCRKYSVNEEWLRTGNGEMYIPLTLNQLILSKMNEVCSENDDNFKKRFHSALCSMSDDGWLALEKFVDEFTKNYKPKETESEQDKE